MRRSVSAVLIALLVALALLPVPANEVAAQDGGEQCAQIVSDAINAVDENCAGLGPNGACVGSEQADFVPFPSATLPGDTGAGFTTELTPVQIITTSGLNVAENEYGIVTMSVPANFHTSLGVQAQFLLMGDVEMTNEVDPADAFVPGALVTVTTSGSADLLAGPAAGSPALETVPAGTSLDADAVDPSGEYVRVATVNGELAWLALADVQAADTDALPVFTADSLTPFQAFSFTTGFDNFGCAAAPPSLITIQSPRNLAVRFIANDVEMEISGSIVLRLISPDVMQVLTVDGDVEVYPGDFNAVNVPAGVLLNIRLGSGTWENWRVGTEAEWQQFGALEFIPLGVITTQYTIPGIIQPSIIEPGQTIIVETPFGIFQYPFEELVVDYIIDYERGEFGQELPRTAFVPFETGCAACPEFELYASNNDGDFDIYRLQADGLATPETNISQGAGTIDAQPTYFADGEHVVWMNVDNNGNPEIYVSDRNGDNRQRITFNTATDTNPVAGPNSWMAFESDREAQWDILIFDTGQDGLPVNVTEDQDGNSVNPYWGPAGGCEFPDEPEWLVYQNDSDGDYEIYWRNVVSGEMIQLTDNDMRDTLPAATQDGAYVYFLREDEFGVDNLWRLNIESGMEEEVAAIGVDIKGFNLSTDGELVTYYADVDGDDEVFVVETNTFTNKQVTNNDFEDRAPVFQCDADTVFYHSDQDAEQFDIFEIDPLPLDGPSPAAQQRTFNLEAVDQYAQAGVGDEVYSKQKSKYPVTR